MQARERPLGRKLGSTFEGLDRALVVFLLLVGDSQCVVDVPSLGIQTDSLVERRNRLPVLPFVDGDPGFAKQLLCFKLPIAGVQGP